MQNKSTLITVIVAVVVGATSFWGGTVYEKNVFAQQRTARAGNGQLAGQASGQNGQARGQRTGNPGNGGGFISGNITAKDDKSITVKMPDNSSKIIYFSDTTTVGKTSQGSSSDLAVGEQVMVNGISSPDGSIAAQNIQIRPAANQ